MERDLQIHTEDIGRLWTELASAVEYFHGLGYEWCDVLFGWAWFTGPDSHDLSWKSVKIPLLDLKAEILREEAAGRGAFADDDVFVSFEGLAHQIQFCHHEGVHLLYPEPDEIARHFRDRWRSEGLDLCEFEKIDGGSEWRRVHGEDA